MTGKVKMLDDMYFWRTWTKLAVNVSSAKENFEQFKKNYFCNVY